MAPGIIFLPNAVQMESSIKDVPEQVWEDNEVPWDRVVDELRTHLQFPAGYVQNTTI